MQLFSSISHDAKLCISSPYMNFSSNYKHTLLTTHAELEVLTASPKVFIVVFIVRLTVAGKRLLHRQRYF
jgi:hypothetical protein